MSTHDGDATSREGSVAAMKVYVPRHDVIEPAFAENNIPVFLGCDDNFLPHAATVIASVMRHASQDRNYDIFIVQSGVPEGRMAVLSTWMRRFSNACLRFVDVSSLVQEIGEEYFPTTKQFPVAVFFRIFAPGVFTRYDKMAYLDSDVVMLDDVADFYNTDLEGHPLAACHDFAIECQSIADPGTASYWREKLGKEPGESSFNSGMLVMDLRMMRDHDLERKMLRKMQELGNPALPDQEVMNSVLGTNVKYLGAEWNLMDWMADPYESSPNFRFLDHKTLTYIRDIRGKNKVLHFSEKKPWTLDYIGKFDCLYWEYAAMTPFFEETVAKLNTECSLCSLVSRYIILSLQEVNFAIRGWFVAPTNKAKYANRRNNVLAHKKVTIKHIRRMWSKSAKTPSGVLRPR